MYAYNGLFCKIKLLLYTVNLYTSNEVIGIELSKNIKKLRLKRGLTQKELASETNYSVTYISDIETGRTVPSVKTLISLGEALSVGISVLVDEPCCYLNIKAGKGCKYEEDFERCKICPLYKNESVD